MDRGTRKYILKEFHEFIEKFENSNLPIAGIYREHENTKLGTNYTLEDAKEVCIVFEVNILQNEKHCWN